MRMTLLALGAAAMAGSAVAAEKDWRFGDGVAPERWSLIKSDYALCDVGLMQSPVDLALPKAIGDVALTTDFRQATGKLKLGDQKVQVDFEPGMGMVSGGKQFGLVQFHTPAEHAMSGQRAPVELHFVHATAAGELGVLGVMFREGAANPALQAVIDAIAKGDGTGVSLNVAALAPASPRVYRYMGSLTTPPCSEGVNWHVATQELTASAAQLAALRSALGPSARSLQPLGNRLLVAPTR